MFRILPMHRGYMLFVLLISLLTCQFALAASLIPDKSEIAIGETTYIKLDADFVLTIDWSASPGIAILDSGRGGATIKGAAAGPASVTAKINGKKKSVQIVVKPAQTAPAAATGEILFQRDNASTPTQLAPMPAWPEPPAINTQGVQSGTLILPPSSLPPADIQAILDELAQKAKKLADLTVDTADDKLGPGRHAGSVAAHGGGGQALTEWANYWKNLSQGLDNQGHKIPRDQWRAMFEGADKKAQWEKYKDWFGEQTGKLEKLGRAISIVDSGSKVAGALYGGGARVAAVTLADEICKTGAVAFGGLFGAPWGPFGSVAGAAAGEELWGAFGHPEFERKAQFVKNLETWNATAGDKVRRTIGNLREFDGFMQGTVSEAEFRKAVHAYAEKYKQANEKREQQRQNEVALLRQQAKAEPGLTPLIDIYESPATKLSPEQRVQLKEALQRAIQAKHAAGGKVDDDMRCALPPAGGRDYTAVPTPPPPQISDQQTNDYLNCLCRYCGGASGGHFTRDAKSDCNGGCSCYGPLSGWCTAVPTPDAAVKACYAGAFGVAEPNLAQIRQGQEIARAKNLQKLETTLQQQLSKNDLDGAVSSADNALKMDPGMESPMFREVARRARTAGWDALNKADHQTAVKRLEQAYSLDPNDADTQTKLQQARDYALQWPRVEAKAKEFDEFIAGRKVWSAQRAMLEMQDVLRGMAAGQSALNPVWQRVTHDFNQGLEDYNRFIQDKSARHTQFFKAQDYAAILRNAEEMRQRELSPADAREAQSRIDFANRFLGAGTVAGMPAGEAGWAVVETTPGMYRVERASGQVRIARQGNNPGGLQHAGLRLDRGLPVSGDFDAQVSFADARIEGGLNQIELHATFADGAIFFVVRDREGSGSHIWAPGLQGNQPCGRAGTLRMERRGETVTGYCDSRAIWSTKRPAALTRLQFVLQNNGSNDPISVTFRDYRFNAAATASGGGSAGNVPGLAGTWSINANNYTGKLEFTQSSGKLAGHVWFDAHGVWEDLRDISFDGRTLRFLRPGPNQHYTGTLAGNQVRGTFDGGGSWNWVITRVSGSSSAQMPPVAEGSRPATAKLVLEDDKGPYSWVEGTEVQTKQIHAGRAAFRSTGNNHFTHRLGIAGNYADQYRYLDFWIYLMNPSADIQLQVQVDGAWGKRWGFDGDATYNGYGWAMEGTTAGLPAGRWLHQRVDLMQQLHIDAGQAITGLAFSSDGGDVYYDSVYLIPSASPTPPPHGALGGKRVLEDDAGPYNWVEKTSVQKEVIAHGQAAFRSTGNNHFTTELGVVGDYPEQFRNLSFWLFPIGGEADLQLQVQVDGTWGKRWGFDAGPKYNGYGWAMEGTTTGLKPGQWQEITVDLLNQLHINPGQKITGLAFSSDNGDVYYDSVYLHPNPNPARKPSFQPAGKLVLEDSADGYNWVERTEVENYLVFNGAKAFRSTGNNHFLADLGVAGSGRNQFRHLNFWAFFMGPEADIQVQVQVNGSWGKRWGYDAGPVYNGYGWAMEGTSTRMTSGRWVQIQLDLIGQLHLKPGDKITGLAFSSDNADVIYDSVYLLPDGVTPTVGGGFQGGESGQSGGRDYTSMPPPTPEERQPPVSGGGCVNLARGKPASQSSTSQWSHANDAQGAVDGIINGSYAFHTENERNPWWQVDLGNRSGLSEVRVFNRLDCCAERARTLQVLLSDDARNWRNVYQHGGAVFGGKDGKPLVVGLGGESARYLRLQLNESNWFHLDEVEVCGEAATSPGGRDYTGQEPTAAKSAVLFDNGNIAGVGNGPSQPTSFSLSTAHVITLIQDYHWNSARGATPGSIGLRDAGGRVYGPWQSVGTPGQGGVPNAYWTVRPEITLPAGVYSVIDSHPASWSRNGGSQQRGFSRVEGYPTNEASGRDSSYAAPPSRSSNPADQAEPSIQEQTERALEALERMFKK